MKYTASESGFTRLFVLSTSISDSRRNEYLLILFWIKSRAIFSILFSLGAPCVIQLLTRGILLGKYLQIYIHGSYNFRQTKFIKRYCKDLDINLVFSSYKIGNMFGVKDPIPGGLLSSVVYKFTCAGCNACYVGETVRHFCTRVKKHLISDRASHIFKHLQNSENCHASSSADCFCVLDHDSTSFNLR